MLARVLGSSEATLFAGAPALEVTGSTLGVAGLIAMLPDARVVPGPHQGIVPGLGRAADP